MNFERSVQFNSPTSLSEDDFDGYHAAPLLLSGPEAKPRLIERQNQLGRNFENATREILTGAVKPGVVDFVAWSIKMRMGQRESLNSRSYVDRRNKHPRVDLAPQVSPLDVHWHTYQARMGNGLIAGNALAGHVLGMDDVELSNVTVIGDFRSNVRDEMYADASDYFGQDVAPTVDQRYDAIRVVGYDRVIETGGHIGAIRVEMSRKLAMGAFGSMGKARRFAVIDTSPSSGFNQVTVDRFISAARSGQHLSSKAIRWMMEEELPSARVIASNDTIYQTKRK